MIILGLSAINNTKAPMELSLMVCADCFGLRTQLVIAIQGDISTADQITDSRLIPTYVFSFVDRSYCRLR